MKYSVVIATYNRAGDLRDTLASLAELRPNGPWEVVVVDNNALPIVTPVGRSALQALSGLSPMVCVASVNHSFLPVNVVTDGVVDIVLPRQRIRQFDVHPPALTFEAQ